MTRDEPRFECDVCGEVYPDRHYIREIPDLVETVYICREGRPETHLGFHVEIRLREPGNQPWKTIRFPTEAMARRHAQDRIKADAEYAVVIDRRGYFPKQVAEYQGGE